MRQFRANPKGSTMKAVISITLPSVILFLLNHDDDRYKELPQWQKDMFWIVLTKNHIIRIPKPFELGDTVRHSTREGACVDPEKDPDAFKELGKTVREGLIPGYIPTAAIPIIEAFGNRSTFTGRPIVPEREKRLDPKYQLDHIQPRRRRQ